MKKFACSLAILLSCIIAFAQVKVGHLLTENLSNPIGLGIQQPRFSWQLMAPERGLRQTAYEIRVSGQTAGKSEAWSSGKINSDQSLWVPYAGTPLRSGIRYYWQVRIWDNKDRSSGWSTPAYWQTSLLAPGDYVARWIGPGFAEPPSRPSPLFRKEFTAARPVQSATAYITAHGLYEAQLNGRPIGDGCLQPGWTSYHKRLQYQTYDVTELIRNGRNALGVTLASGWYRGYIGFEGQKNYYGKDISLLLQLLIKYKDGSTETIASDGSWKSSTSMIRSAELYNGETIDARQEKTGWALPGYDDREWSGVQLSDFPMDNLVASCNEPVKRQEIFHPQRIFNSPAGEQLVDFGQNMVGRVVLKANGKTGDRIVIAHAEVLDKSGNFYTENLRSAKASDTFILKGGGEEVFEPRFTFHGFRYVRVEGYPGKLRPEDLQAVALYSDMPRTGDFHCSNPLINQLQHNIQWGQRGNFLDVPTDCPQRDERLGWTGDAQVFSRTAAFNMGVDNFFAKWLKDVAADQSSIGAVPFVIPNVIGNGSSAGWADVATIIPWNIYLAYGDRRVLEEQYPSMKAWVGYIRSQSKNDLWNTGFHFGDWLFYRPFDDNDGRAAVTDKYLIAQCFYAHSTQLLIDAAKTLDKKEEAAVYEQLLKRIKAAFVREYMTSNGRLVSGTQTAYVLALQFDMLPDSLQAQAAKRLADNVKDYNYHLTTGFLGTPYLCHVLSRWGYTDIAYRLLMQESYPSWLYPVKMGATTIWERWDGIKPDSSFQTPGMNSFNHYSYGAIGDWMYRVVAGIDTYEDKDGVGYKHSRIYPHPGGGLTEAEGRLTTGYGELESHWRIEKDSLLLDIVIPPNTSSTVYIPAPEGGLVTESGHLLGNVKDITVAGVGRGFLMLNLGSGSYHFAVKKSEEQPGAERGK